MAKPDLDDGYLRLAHELFAAVCCAGFSRWEMVVLREVFDQIYGPHKLETARLSPTDIAGRTGTFKESIVRAIRTLVESGVLAKAGEQEYRFLKNYEIWQQGGVSRFSGRELIYCAATKRQVKSRAIGNNGAPTHKPTTGTTALPINDHGEQRRSPGGTVALPDGSAVVPHDSLFDVVPPTPPIEEPGRASARKNLEEIKKEERERTPAPSVAPLDPEYDRIGNLAMELGQDFNWGPWVSTMGRIGYPAAWVEDVVKKMAGRGEMSMSLGHGILKRYQAQGGPDKPVGYSKAKENNGKTAVQQRPEDTVAKLKRPDMPRTPEFEAAHQMWDEMENDRRKNGVAS